MYTNIFPMQCLDVWWLTGALWIMANGLRRVDMKVLRRLYPCCMEHARNSLSSRFSQAHRYQKISGWLWGPKVDKFGVLIETRVYLFTTILSDCSCVPCGHIYFASGRKSVRNLGAIPTWTRYQLITLYMGWFWGCIYTRIIYIRVEYYSCKSVFMKMCIQEPFPLYNMQEHLYKLLPYRRTLER